MSQPETDILKVAIAKADTPLDTYNEIIMKLGGMKKFVSKNDRIFIKINLNTPEGFPVNISFPLINFLIKSCKKAGSSDISVGSFSNKGIKIRNIDNLLKINESLLTTGGQLIYLDEESESNFAELIQNYDKYFVLNQINVDPLFECTLSIINSSKYNNLNSHDFMGQDLASDFYKKEMISEFLNEYKKRKPDLVINDLYHVMEGAGPDIYKDSNLIKTQLMVGGTDPIAIDLITLKLLNMNPLNNPLILSAREKNIGITDINKINIMGVDLESFMVKIKQCEKNLEDISVYNSRIKQGSICSGCYHIAYHLLNLMKTYMTKDLKYIAGQSILIGKNPPEPESKKNIILFGNCAIDSTKDYSFNTLTISKERISIVDKIKKKEKQSRKKVKIIEKTNKEILCISGCPPNLNACVKLILDYYGKQQVPNLYLYDKIMETYTTSNKKRGNHD